MKPIDPKLKRMLSLIRAAFLMAAKAIEEYLKSEEPERVEIRPGDSVSVP